MANTHPANLGDVLKHLALCEAFSDQPERYQESHAGAPSYSLEGEKTGPGGIWDFIEMCRGSSLLRDSQYAHLQGSLPGTRDAPGTYLGSVGLAAAGLPASVPLRVAELDAGTAGLLRKALPAPRCCVIEGDGLSMIESDTRPGDLVLIDPFKMSRDTRSDAALDPVTAFICAATTGARTLLWYPIHRPRQALAWMPQAWPRDTALPTRIEIRRTNTQAGLAGCGLLIAGLSEEAEERICSITAAFGSALVNRWPKHRFFSMTSDGSCGNPLAPHIQGTG